jgi:hypothetical protein
MGCIVAGKEYPSQLWGFSAAKLQRACAERGSSMLYIEKGDMPQG